MMTIYTLIDPRDNLAKYVGITNDVSKRYSAHCHVFNGNNPRVCWLKCLNKLGLKPIFEVLETYKTREEAEEAEIFWIGYLKMLGAELKNTAIGGGSGSSGTKHTEETKKKMSLSKTGINRKGEGLGSKHKDVSISRFTFSDDTQVDMDAISFAKKYGCNHTTIYRAINSGRNAFTTRSGISVINIKPIQ